jgi:hypothetical protein
MNYRIPISISTAFLLIAGSASGQAIPKEEMTARSQKASLARAFCSGKPGERGRAVTTVVENPRATLPWLMAWTKCSPKGGWDSCKGEVPIVYGADPSCLFFPMVEVFSQLRVKEAVPYLIANVDIDPGHNRARTPLSTETPAIQALLRIGGDATPALLEALSKMPYCRDCDHALRRLGIIIALAQIVDPRARPALEEAATHPGWEQMTAKEGLRLLDARR